MDIAAIISDVEVLQAPTPAPEPAPFVVLRGVTRLHRSGRRSIEALAPTDMAVLDGEFVAIMGPSGSGKTTLLNLMGGLDRPTRGDIAVQGSRIGHLSSRALARWRSRHVGFVFQFYNLIAVLDALDNVALPLALQGVGRRQRQQRAAAALQMVGLQDLLKQRPREMSGGEQQRVAIARAIVTNPSLLLCDEPTGDLDRENAMEVIELLRVFNAEYGKTIVMVTHDSDVARHADRIVRIDKGRVVGASS
ncbi:ABC transporter ATP-binding protein [Xanthomonas sp. MUS 060]|uniref:ABC transporter ATP-binding protein n=1 Tax=Xanthomonas sp. MUS 060 TaxID=1588031 RepID=UPI0009E64B1D|nr:ABC transporter ATP-binding protein [Xanthomonas sp. MUS 060]